jgi:predicted KAP-like P-loop ATPase
MGLVSSFRDNNESLVLGINGDWGSGKSTLINFIVSEIEKLSSENNSEIITLRFNPWMFSGQKEIQNIFLKELFHKLENNKAKFKDASQKIANFLDYLNWLKYVHPGAGEMLKDGKDFLEGINKKKDLSELKKKIDQILIDSKVKLYITIDDIDRLSPSEITDIFQLVKLNGNFANTIFILAYDQKIVTSALN